MTHAIFLACLGAILEKIAKATNDEMIELCETRSYVSDAMYNLAFEVYGNEGSEEKAKAKYGHLFPQVKKAVEKFEQFAYVA